VIKPLQEWAKEFKKELHRRFDLGQGAWVVVFTVDVFILPPKCGVKYVGKKREPQGEPEGPKRKAFEILRSSNAA
jgi:hypothetical protein